MKIVFVGCVEFSSVILREIIDLSEVEVTGIVTKRSSSFNADFVALEPIATKRGIPCHVYEKGAESLLAGFLRNLNPDVVFCFGWSHLLPVEILKIPRLGVVGYHPAALPQNRGRHPLIWALALGLRETASTFFFMDGDADSGDILDQENVAIEDADDAGSLYCKLTNIALIQVNRICKALASGAFKRTPQNHADANTWRKRSKEDGRIDWRMSAHSIHNLIRALARPYIGAHCLFEGIEVKIWKSEPILEAAKNLEPGKVIESVDGYPVVKCGEGAIRILEHEFRTLPKKGSYL
jgi:methionyl-tRNA formyltransferase